VKEVIKAPIPAEHIQLQEAFDGLVAKCRGTAMNQVHYNINIFPGPMYVVASMDIFPNEQNFDLDKSRQHVQFHYSLKEHHKISNIPRFRLRNVVKCG
jgi:hypothetical protein